MRIPRRSAIFSMGVLSVLCLLMVVGVSIALGYFAGIRRSSVWLHPLAGEQTTYASTRNDPSQRTYGVAACVPNLDGTGHVLLIEGINMAGTQATGTFLLSPALMKPELERAIGSDGMIRPFEILFETSSVAANASRTKILSNVGQENIWPFSPCTHAPLGLKRLRENGQSRKLPAPRCVVILAQAIDLGSGTPDLG